MPRFRAAPGVDTSHGPVQGKPVHHGQAWRRFAPDATVLLGFYDPDTDPENARILAKNAALLQVTTNVAGQPFRILRVPMLENRDGVFRTYLNSLVVNEVVQISLRRRRGRGFGGEAYHFVQCDQVDCQYADENAPPCPLRLELFAADLASS